MTGDDKQMLHGPGNILNRYVKYYSLDNLSIYKTEILSTQSKYLNAEIEPHYKCAIQNHEDLKIEKTEHEIPK